MDSLLLLDRLKNGCRKSFHDLFDAHYEELVHYCHSYLYDKSLCEDVVQEAFIHFWENRKAIRIHSSIRNYLYSMVRNKALNHLKNLKVTDDLKVLDLSYTYEEQVEEISLSRYEKVKKIMAKMPLRMRKIFELRYISNYSYIEISEELGISLNTVKTQLVRAKSKILHSIHIFYLLLFFKL